jgi:hypothetical protein
MLVVRNVFRAKYGMGDDLVQLFRDGMEMWPSAHNFRILTDASGPFFTVVAEMSFADFAEYEKSEQEEFSHAEFGAWFAKMVPLVETGHREFLRVAYP